jgi:hypothetical protein
VRKITINSPTGNIWLAHCAELFFYSIAQTGIVSGDTLYINPYPPATFTTTPGSTFTVSLGIGNDPGLADTCSPGAYDEYVTGTDGVRSNDQYIPILSPWNMWAGYNTTDEFQSDFAAQTTCPYKLTDGTPDGVCLPTGDLATVIDGDNLISSSLGGLGIGVMNISTGTPTWANSLSGNNIVGIAAKNGIVGYSQQVTPSYPSVAEDSFFTEKPGPCPPVCSSSTLPVADVSNVGTAPAAIAMSTCSGSSNTASAFSYDQEGAVLYRVDAVGDFTAGTVTASRIGSVSLSGFTQASQLTTTLARYVIAWDGSCKAAVLAPVLTGGTNPDGSAAYEMQFALVDMTVGTMRQLGTYVSSTTVNGVTTSIPSTAIRMVADPSGNDVVIASTDQTAGKTILTKVSWTLDSNENPTFTVTTLNAVPPVGVYGVSLGILPASVVPNGMTLRVGQRQQHFAFTNQ